MPGEAFGPSGYLRLSYALGDDALLEGVQRLQRSSPNSSIGSGVRGSARRSRSCGR